MSAPTEGSAAGFAMFDLDNTLIDRQAAFVAWAADFVARRRLGGAALDELIDLDRDGFASREEVFGPMRTRYSLPESVEELVAQYRISYPGFVASEPAVVAALRRLREARWRLAIVTNGPPSQHEKITRAGLAPCFDALVVSEEVGVRKPEPAIFELAAHLAGIDRSLLGASWMVGDAAHYDVGGGRSAGVRTLWMRRGREWTEADYAPDAQVDSIEQAVDVLLRAPGPPAIA